MKGAPPLGAKGGRKGGMSSREGMILEILACAPVIKSMDKLTIILAVLCKMNEIVGQRPPFEFALGFDAYYAQLQPVLKSLKGRGIIRIRKSGAVLAENLPARPWDYPGAKNFSAMGVSVKIMIIGLNNDVEGMTDKAYRAIFSEAPPVRRTRPPDGPKRRGTRAAKPRTRRAGRS